MTEAQAPYLNSEQRARVLGEALGRTRELRGDIAVIKYGGYATIDPDAQEVLAFNVQSLQHVGMFSVVVHGSGPQVSAMLDKLGIETLFCERVRVTAPEAMEIVRMVFTGQVQRRLVSRLNQRNSFVIGISGEDGVPFNAKCRTGADEKGEETDFGLVDEATSVDPSTVLELLDVGRIPVISSIAIDQDSARQVLNTNADAAASALAVALGVSKPLMLIDVEGVHPNYPDPGSLLHHTIPSRLRALGDVTPSGVIPKAQARFQATKGGVDAVHVVGGRQMHSVLIGTMADKDTSTTVVPNSVEKDV